MNLRPGQIVTLVAGVVLVISAGAEEKLSVSLC